jgi:hypothetical protein
MIRNSNGITIIEVKQDTKYFANQLTGQGFVVYSNLIANK